MATTLTSKLNIQLDAAFQKPVGVAGGQATLSRGLVTSLANGVGATQADLIYSETKSAAGNYDVDLSGVLADAFGATILFARIKALIVLPDPTNAGNVIVGGAGANQFFGFFGTATDKVNVRPGGALVILAPDATGYPVTAGTADILRFAPSAGTVLFDFILIGASA